LTLNNFFTVYFLIGLIVGLIYHFLLTFNLKGKFFKIMMFILNLLFWPIIVIAFILGIMNLIIFGIDYKQLTNKRGKNERE